MKPEKKTKNVSHGAKRTPLHRDIDTQKVILALLDQGMSQKQVALRLGWSRSTVAKVNLRIGPYQTHIRRKK